MSGIRPIVLLCIWDSPDPWVHHRCPLHECDGFPPMPCGSERREPTREQYVAAVRARHALRKPHPDALEDPMVDVVGWLKAEIAWGLQDAMIEVDAAMLYSEGTPPAEPERPAPSLPDPGHYPRPRSYRYAHRAGWPDRQNPAHPVRRVGRGWLRVGPWVIGDTAAWDRSGCP